MIKYKLICKSCNLSFDSWFASSSEFEKLKKRNLLNCLKCNSKKVDKTLMAPKLVKNIFNQTKNSQEKISAKNINKKFKEYQKFIEKNFEYVGENFAFEARSIHYNKKKSKGIYGTASDSEMRELQEEGIETEIIPWIKDKNN